MSDRERAKIKISLVSKGARSSLEGFVTPEQWGQIVATVNGQPAQATPLASGEPDKKDAEWQPTESMPEGWGSQNFVERLGDMSPLGRLRVAFDNDGDVIVAIVPDPNSYDTGGSVEFCTTGFGGGGSPHTRNACIALFKAMERDNESNRARCGLIGRGAAITAAIAEQEPNK